VLDPFSPGMEQSQIRLLDLVVSDAQQCRAHVLSGTGSASKADTGGPSSDSGTDKVQMARGE
jgi:hypothetical protein